MKIEQIYKWLLISTAATMVIAIIFIFFQFYSIRDCEVEYGEIIQWGFQNPEDYKLNYLTFEPESYEKFLDYRIKNNTIHMEINESTPLETIKNQFPVGNDYIFTICNSKIKSLDRRDWIKDTFFYKLAKFI